MSDLNLSSTFVSMVMSERRRSSPRACTSLLLIPSSPIMSSLIVCVLHGVLSGGSRCFVPASAMPLL